MYIDEFTATYKTPHTKCDVFYYIARSLDPINFWYNDLGSHMMNSYMGIPLKKFIPSEPIPNCENTCLSSGYTIFIWNKFWKKKTWSPNKTSKTNEGNLFDLRIMYRRRCQRFIFENIGII